MSGLTTTSPSFLPILQVRCHFVPVDLAGINTVHPPWTGMFPHFSRRIPGFCTDIRRVLHSPTGTGYRTSDFRPRISESCVTKPGRPRELNPWPKSAPKVTPNPRSRKWISGRIRRASAGLDRVSREPHRVRILPCPGPGVHARRQPDPVAPEVVDPADRCPRRDATVVTEESFPTSWPRS